MFRKVLIANRGEIALRVIRTCREMGIASVAVYSDADKESLHVQRADEAVNIGPPLARKSYLNGDAIIEAARKTGAEAIHPGYGFLAEDARFSGACRDKGVVFIGPSPESQSLVGDKIACRKIAEQVGVPLSPGSEGAVSRVEDALDVARRLGYPVIIKASGGGGGKGMRIANSEDELPNFIKICKGEAGAAFGNPDVFIEKYIVEPRHIEIQFLADGLGHCIHLGERECSIQRKHQKLVEEAPSAFIDEVLRQKIAGAAMAIAKAVKYKGAGTAEFLMGSDKQFYFNEINARLQVEHPVTEMVTGVDLVKQQILIAATGKLELSQEAICYNGWSIECRINAEDPENEFRPSPGKTTRVIPPGGFGVRVDTLLYSGYEVVPFYDSLLAKLIVWAKDRDQAVLRMRRALGEFDITGIKTTIPLHKRIFEDEDFRRGHINTHYLKNRFNL